MTTFRYPIPTHVKWVPTALESLIGLRWPAYVSMVFDARTAQADVVMEITAAEVDGTQLVITAEVVEPKCESCGADAAVRLPAGSTWCNECHGSAIRLGYDTAIQ